MTGQQDTNDEGIRNDQGTYSIAFMLSSTAVDLTVSHQTQQVPQVPTTQLHRSRIMTVLVGEQRDSPHPLASLLHLCPPLLDLLHRKPPLPSLPLLDCPFLPRHRLIPEEMVPPLPPLKSLDAVAPGMIVQTLSRMAAILKSVSALSLWEALPIRRQMA